MRNFILKMSLGFLSLLLFFSQLASAQSELMAYADFMPDRYTSNFKKGVQSKLVGSGLIDNEKVSVNMSFIQKAGIVGKFAGRQWIKVGVSGNAKVGSESADISLTELYDPETKLKMYEIDVKDKKTKQFVWNSLPKLLPLGELLEAGSFTEKDNDGKLIKIGKISYKLVRIANGFEFCHIHSGKDLETGMNEFVEDCDQFSIDKKHTGFRAKVNLGEDAELLVSGKSVLR
jgi:hypothetical protein